METQERPEPPDPAKSAPGEPVFNMGAVEIAPGVNMVVVQILLNGVSIQVMLRPELAISVAGGLDSIAKQARAGLQIIREMPNGIA